MSEVIFKKGNKKVAFVTKVNDYVAFFLTFCHKNVNKFNVKI